ncbi:sigma-54 dependent transcriptional regulator [Vibrio hannami]|uniref:sigma-54-dependent transcriptional regulator n=1 Tax=Vibrio hannami TaxID=2717094 RepID=UPI0024100FAA|nr:sigma-54 dependent transcriptional regulator [Vibrio hannami]MDG3086833.1 sigma-54 dependent transcriptional regulator [Vibrio hannami]
MKVDNTTTVLIVDDDQDVLDSYKHLLSITDIQSLCLVDPTQALKALPRDWPGIIVLDMYMPQMSGMDLLVQIKEFDENIPIILVTGHGDIPMAVKALQHGACDFLEKPINPNEFLQLITRHLKVRNTFFQRKEELSKSVKRHFIGKSARSKLIREHIVKLSMLDKHISIIGKPGTGRSHVASLIHEYRHQTNENLIKISGHQVKGFAEIESVFNQNASSTILFRGIENLDLEIQQQLLDTLLSQEHKAIFNIRIIALFEESPENLIANQQLVPSLYYILNQGHIEVPPLVDRPDDIAHLFHHFLKQSCRTLNKVLPEVSANYLSVLRSHLWLGNVRELKNVAELYAVGIVKLTKQERLHSSESHETPLDCQVDNFEKQLIEDALFLHSGKVTEAANHLKIPRKKLYLRMKKHGLEKEAFKSR